MQDNSDTQKLWGLIDTSGDYVLQPTFSDVGEFTSDELAAAQDKDRNTHLHHPDRVQKRLHQRKSTPYHRLAELQNFQNGQYIPKLPMI